MPEFKLMGFPDNLSAMSVTIPNGASVSEMIATQGRALVGIVMPAAWTAAAIGYKVCLSGNAADLLPVYDSGGNAMTTSAAASTHIAFPTSDAIFAPFLQIASVTAATATGVNQGADRTLLLLFRSFLS